MRRGRASVLFVFAANDETFVFFVDVKIVRILRCDAHFFAKFLWDVDGSFLGDVAFIIGGILSGGFDIDGIVLINELRHFAGDEPEALPPLFGQSDHPAVTEGFVFIQLAQNIETPSFLVYFSITRNLESINTILQKWEFRQRQNV